MKQQQVSPKIDRQRKFLMVLPVIALPFIALLLWTMGVVGGTPPAEAAASKTGINMELPRPTTNKDSAWNKLRFYEKADRDSADYRKLMRNDPYYRTPELVAIPPAEDVLLPVKGKSSSGFSYEPAPAPAPTGLRIEKDRNEEKVYQRLAQLNAALTQAEVAEKKPEPTTSAPYAKPGVTVNSQDIDRLESMMLQMQHKEGAEDPELAQLNGMLEKILDIQHPDRVREKVGTPSASPSKEVLAVVAADAEVRITQPSPAPSATPLIGLPTPADRPSPLRKNRFYGLKEQVVWREQRNTLPAVIHETQTLVSGSTVKLRLTADVEIAGVRIPKDHFVYGLANLNGERLHVQISSIRYGERIFPVSLTVFDRDGLEGIYMPGAITREVAKQSGDQAIQSFGLSTLDPSLGAQAASAGLQATKSLLGKKAKLVRVSVKQGYEVFLKAE